MRLFILVVFAIVAFSNLFYAKYEKLDIKVITASKDCSRKVKSGDRIVVKYAGKLVDGSVFDATSGERTFTTQIGVGHVIRGWDEGLIGACIGEKRELHIPSDMGYGARGAPPKIPSNADLIFEVEVVDIVTKLG